MDSDVFGGIYTAIVALVVAAIFAALALLHVYWAARGLEGGSAAIPERDGKPLFVPSRTASLVVAALLALAVPLVLQRATIGPELLPEAIVPVGCWTLSFVMLARAVGDFRYVGFFKRVRGTRFATLDTRYYSPLVLLLGLGAAYVAYTGS